MPTYRLIKLYRQLLNFGLNPSEWLIEHHSDQTYEILKIDDPEFRFMGTIKGNKWTQIWLASV